MSFQDQFKNVNWKDIGNAQPGPKILVLVLILATLIGLGWYFYWDGLDQDLKRQQQDELKLREEWKKRKTDAVNLPELKKQKVQVEQFVAALEKQLPSKAEMDALLTDINQAGLGRGLAFELFRPGAVNVKEYYAELPISVRVTGNYHDLGTFASDIAGLSRIVTLNDMDITLPAGGQVLGMNTIAKTFRYLDQDEVNAQKKATAPKAGAKK
jgi:type IV pilus assembly protein PilO